MNYKIATVVCAAALVLTGCGGVAPPTPVDDPGGTTGTEPAVASPAPVVPSASPAGGDSSLTPTGTTLRVGKTATVRYETKPSSKESTKLAVTALSLKKGSIDDLKNFELDAQSKVSVPFYVTMKFRNVGSKPMDPSGIFGLIEVHNAAGDELGRMSLIGEFKPCDGLPPKQLAVGASFTECDVYLAPAGQNAASVNFGFYLGDADRTEITWTTG